MSWILRSVDRVLHGLSWLCPSPQLAPRSNHEPAKSLPPELIEHIADYLFEIRPPAPDFAGNVPLCHEKPLWSEISGFMSASLELHRMGVARWLRVLTVRGPDDWTMVSQNSHLVR